MTAFGDYTIKVKTTVTPLDIGVTPSAVASQPNSVNAHKITGGNTDRYKFTGEGNTEHKKHDYKHLNQTVRAMCAENGIDPILLPDCLIEVMGAEPQTEEQKAEALAFVKHSMLRAKRFGAKHNKKNINLLKTVVLDAKFMHDAVTKGTFSDLEDIDERGKEYGIDNVQQELFEEDWNKLSDKEKRFRASKARSQMLALKKAKEAEIAKLPAEEQEAAKIKLEQEMEAFSGNIFNAILMKVDSDSAIQALTIGGADNVGNYAEKLMETRSNDTEKQRIANKMNYSFYEESILKELYEQGEHFNTEALSKYNSSVVAWKNKEAADAYQNAYREAREKFQNGEGPDYYSEEIFKATAEGIGFGARINHIMTAEEKAEFSITWERDALNFGDNDVIESVNKKVEAYKQEHPNEAKEIEKTEEIINKIKEKNSNIKSGTNDRATFSTTTNPLKREFSKSEESSTIYKVQQDDKILKDIKSGKFTIQEACKKSPHVVEVILSDSELRKAFLSDNNMVDLYQSAIKIYIKANLHKTEEKVDFVINNPKTLPIMIGCLDSDEKENFEENIKGNLSSTIVNAYFA